MAKLIDPLAQARPTPRPARGIVPLRTVGPSGAEGQGLSALGQALGAGAEEIYRAQKQEEDRINALRAEEAVTKLNESQLDLTFGEQNGFTKRHGAEAVTKPFMPDYLRRFDDSESRIAGELANDEQREQFKRHSQVNRQRFHEAMLRHLSTESNNYSKEVFDGIVASEQRAAVARWNSPADIGASLVRVQNAVEERAERFGWAPDYKKAVLLQEQGKIHSAVIQQAIASSDYTYAEAWYKANREQVDLPTAKLLERAVEDGAQKDLINGYNAEYLKSEDDYRALDELRHKALADKSLRDDRKNALIGRIQNRQYVLERRVEVEESKRLRAVERGLTTLNANTLAGFEPSAGDFAPLVAAAEGTELEAEVTKAIFLADATRDFRNRPPLIQERTLTRAEAALRTGQPGPNRKIVGAWRQIYEAQRRQVKDDPIAFAVSQGIVRAPQPLDLSNPDAASQALHERFSIARGVSASYQAPFRPLTKEETTLMSATLKGAPIGKQREWFGALRRSAGADTPGYMAVMSQLAPDAPVLAIAGSHAGRGRDLAADLILRGHMILAPDNKKDGSPDGSSLLPMPAETDMRSRFDSNIRDAFIGRGDSRNAHYQAVKAVYAALSIDAGDGDTKGFKGSRWDEAMDIAIGKVDKYNSKRVILPYGYESDQFEDELKARLYQMVESSKEQAGEVAAVERTLTEAERNIVKYHRDSIAVGNVGVDPEGRPVTVYSTGIQIPSGPHKGKFVAVPGFIEGKIERDEEALYKVWKKDIDAGKWPMYGSGNDLNQRSREIHTIMDIEGGTAGQPGQLDSTWTLDRLADLPLENRGDGRYILRSGDGVVVDLNGRPVIINFNLGNLPAGSGMGLPPEERRAEQRENFGPSDLP